jgi:hypothetical protein
MLIGVIAEELLNPLSVEPGRFIDGPFGGGFGLPDIFLQARIFQIGFVSPGLVDETDVLFGAENLYTTYVTNGYLGIFPDTLIDSETFYDFAHSFVPVLRPPWWIDTDFILSPKLDIKAIAPARYVDSDIIFSPAFYQSLAPGLVVDGDVIRAQVIRRDGDAIVLLLETFDDADVIFAPLTARALLPSYFTEYYPDNDRIYAAGQAAFLLPSLFNSVDVFFAPFISNQLNPSRVVDADVFIGPTVATPGRLGLFVDDDIFFVQLVQFAPLAPALFNDADGFLTEVIASNPALYPQFTDIDVEDTFYPPTVSIGLFLGPHLWPDIDDIRSIPAVILGQVIAPTVINFDADVFYAPNLPPTLSPALFAPADTIFSSILVFDQSLLAVWYIDDETFYAPTVVGLGAPQTSTPSIFTDADAFFAPSITALAAFNGTLSIDGPIMPATPQPTVILVEG